MVTLKKGLFLLFSLSILTTPCFAEDPAPATDAAAAPTAAASAPEAASAPAAASPAAAEPKVAEGQTPLPTPIGRVVWVKGTLAAVMQNGEKRDLKRTSIIYLHDTMVTDEKSQGGIVLTDRTLMTFKENTKMSLDKYDFKPDEKKGSFAANVAQGGFRTITGIIGKQNPDDYEVKTAVATIGVRGTDYQLVVWKGKTYVGNYKGKPCLTNRPTDPTKKGKEVCLDGKNKYGAVEDPNADPVAMETAPAPLGGKLKISDAQMGSFKGRSSGSTGGAITSFCITQ